MLWLIIDRVNYLFIICHMPRSYRKQLEYLIKTKGFLDRKCVADAGIHTQYLTRLVAEGALERFAPGRYRYPNAEITEHHGLVLASIAAPRGVVCLLSALSFHGLGTQVPAEIWVAIERGSTAPKLHTASLRVVRYSGEAFSEGIAIHQIERQPVRVYSVAKTLADLFKARNRIGVEVAIEALREAWRDRRFKMSELDRAARVCRVEHVMRPYVEGVVA